ncbi:hypothetical protein WJX72_010429 [[Myrmecia] bisecta]|uniref:E3 ubiquitin protein ligase n=1 Tax=[Myrmecia] bisecta TaxID=41462 RepID=A0AAW1QSJ9_9CHLO
MLHRKAQVSQLEDQQLRDEVAIKDLKNELADKHEEVAAAQRKLVSLRTDAGAEQGAGGSLSRSQSFTAAAAAANKSQPGAGSLKEQAQAAVEVEETIKLLEKRNSQVLAEKEVNLKLQREVQDMKLAVNEESFVAQSKLYQLAQKQLQAQSADLEKQRAIIDSLQRDRDAGLHREQTLQMKAEAAEHARWALSQAEAHIGEVQGQLAAARSAGEATQVQLQAEKARMGNQSSVSELKLMIATLQKETQALKASLDKQKRATQSLEGLREEAEGAVAKVKAKDAEMQHLREKAAKQQEQVKALESKEHDLKERAADLRCFVEVLQSFCEDARDVAEVRTSESRLRSQLQAAEAQLGGKDGILSLADLRRTSAAAQAHAAELEAQNDALRVETIALKRQVEETQASLTAAKAESEAYIAEIDEIGRVYEEMQAQNSRLLAQLTERDDQNNSLVNERIKAGHAAARLAQDRDAAQAAGRRAEAGAEQLRERVVQLEARLKVSIDEAAGVREQVRSYAARLDAAQRKMREQEEALAAKQVLLEDADRAMAERKRVLEEEIEKTSKERTKRQRLEEDHQMLQSKLERLKRTEEVGGVDKMAQKELEGLRALLRCNVCHERPKDVILTTCQHMFCSECVKRNLAMRNRKCPGCGSQYGQNDVKHFYFT